MVGRWVAWKGAVSALWAQLEGDFASGEVNGDLPGPFRGGDFDGVEVVFGRDLFDSGSAGLIFGIGPECGGKVGGFSALAPDKAAGRTDGVGDHGVEELAAWQESHAHAAAVFPDPVDIAGFGKFAGHFEAGVDGGIA